MPARDEAQETVFIGALQVVMGEWFHLLFGYTQKWLGGMTHNRQL